MKKILSCLLCMLLLVSALPAMADTDYAALTNEELRAAYQAIITEMAGRTAPEKATPVTDAEITFRNMAWGVSATEFTANMEAAGVYAKPKKATIYSWERTNLPETDVSYASMPSDRGFVYTVKPTDFSVAGVPVSKIEAYFTYGYDDENVYDTPEQSSLIHAAYKFDDVVDRQATFAILHQKLCGLYGDVPVQQSTKSSSSHTAYHDYAIWYGPNDTALLLHYNTYLKPDGTVYDGYVLHFGLYYGKSNSVQLIKELDAAVAREELESIMNAGSTDGL